MKSQDIMTLAGVSCVLSRAHEGMKNCCSFSLAIKWVPLFFIIFVWASFLSYQMIGCDFIPSPSIEFPGLLHFSRLPAAGAATTAQRNNRGDPGIIGI